MAHSIEKRIARIEANGVEARQADRKVAVRFPPPPPPGRTVLEGDGPGRPLRRPTRCSATSTSFVERGERLLIMGLNGAGKTSLLRVLAGERRARRGQRSPSATTWSPATTPRSTRASTPAARSSSTSASRCPPAPTRCCAPIVGVDGPHRRQGPPGRRHALRRREDQARPRHPRGRPPQPAAARRAHQQPRPRLARWRWPRACADWPGSIVLVSHDADFVRDLAPDQGPADARGHARPLVRRLPRPRRARLGLGDRDRGATRGRRSRCPCRRRR